MISQTILNPLNQLPQFGAGEAMIFNIVIQELRRSLAAILTDPPGLRPSELLPKIYTPLLVLWGETDPWTPIQGIKLYQDMANDATQSLAFQAIPNTGHCPHDEHPDVVNKLILDWLHFQNL